MSALWAPVTGWSVEAPEAPDAGERPRLRAVPRPQSRMARVPFILVLMAIFGLGMAGLLMLNTTLQNQAFVAATLNRQAAELTYTQADLESRIDTAAAPQELARRASAYGLRPNPHPAYLVLPSGKVVGTPTRVAGNEVPWQVIKSPAQLAADRVAAAVRKEAEAAKRVAALQAEVDAEKRQAAAQQQRARQDAASKTAGDTATSAAQAEKPAKQAPGSRPGSSTKAAPAKKKTGRG